MHACSLPASPADTTQPDSRSAPKFNQAVALDEMIPLGKSLFDHAPGMRHLGFRRLAILVRHALSDGC
jgi:hypothetical protein